MVVTRARNFLDRALNVDYNEVLAVPSGIETTIITITAPSVQRLIQSIDVTGENVALFRVKLNGATIFMKRSWWTEFNQSFEFDGLALAVGSTLTVTVFHTRPTVANYEVTVLSR